MPKNYPTTMPTAEIALCIRHHVDKDEDPKEVAKAAWLTVGWFLSVKVGDDTSDAPDNAKTGVRTIKHASEREMLKFADEVEKKDVTEAMTAGALPTWLLPLILQILNGFMNPPK